MYTAARILFLVWTAIIFGSAQSQDQFIDAEPFNPSFLPSGVDISEMINLRTKIHFYNDVYDHIYVRLE